MPDTPTHEHDDPSHATTAGPSDASFDGPSNTAGTGDRITLDLEAVNRAMIERLESQQLTQFINLGATEDGDLLLATRDPQHDDELLTLPRTSISDALASRLGLPPATDRSNTTTAPTHSTQPDGDRANPRRPRLRPPSARLQLLTAIASFATTAYLSYSYYDSTVKNGSLANDLTLAEQQVESLRNEVKELRSRCPAGSSEAGVVEGDGWETVFMRRMDGEWGGDGGSEEGRRGSRWVEMELPDNLWADIDIL
ncbi:hypothetical protein IAT38_004631 [Cryptococcus sp. DSM 104549]